MTAAEIRHPDSVSVVIRTFSPLCYGLCETVLGGEEGGGINTSND